jgi:hypothetical protein
MSAFRGEFDQAVFAARLQMDEGAFAAAWAAGQRLSLNEAAAYACSADPGVAQPAADSRRGSVGHQAVAHAARTPRRHQST